MEQSVCRSLCMPEASVFRRAGRGKAASPVRRGESEAQPSGCHSLSCSTGSDWSIAPRYEAHSCPPSRDREGADLSRCCASLRRDSELSQNCDHRTPLRECRLKQVQPHKGGEQEPAGMHPVAHSHAGHHEKAGDQAEITFDGHTTFLLRFTMK